MEMVRSQNLNTWKDKVAFLVSAFFSPFIVIPIFIFIVTYAYSQTRREFLLFCSAAFLFSTIIPFLNVLIAVKRGKITDIHVAVREERKGPFTIALLSIAVGTLVLWLLGAPREIVILGIVMLLNGIIFFLITLFWKISMHASILAGVLVSLIVLINRWFALGFLIIPLLMWARIHRHRHSFYQGLVATILAAIGTFLVFKAFGLPK